MNKTVLDLFCPSYDMLYGKSKLGFIKKVGVRAKVTDRYIIQGGYVTDDACGCYWMKTDNGNNDACAVDSSGYSEWNNVINRSTGCRPISTFSSICKAAISQVKVERHADGVIKFYFGYDWSKAVSRRFQYELESLYKEGKLVKSTRTFTSDYYSPENYNNLFAPKEEEVYEFEGKVYVRAIARFMRCSAILSNGLRYNRQDTVWCEVVPQRWLYDENTDICMMEMIPFAGIQFNRRRNYKTENFSKTDIKMYLDTFYAPEIMWYT